MTLAAVAIHHSRRPALHLLGASPASHPRLPVLVPLGCRRREHPNLAKTRSEREMYIVTHAALYELLEPVHGPKAGHAYNSATSGPFIFVTEIEMKPKFEDDLNKQWYEEEHMALVAKIPSWVRTRRCVPVNSAAEGSESKGEKPVRFLAPRELEDPAEFEQDDFQVMAWTEWMKSVVQRDSAGVPGASVKVGEDRLGG